MSTVQLLRAGSLALFILMGLIVQGCSGDAGGGNGGGGENGGTGNGSGEPTTASVETATGDLLIPMVRYEWDPEAGDSSVSAEMGGPGFTGEGWETNLEFPAIGQAGAPKGGSMSMYISDWPATLRLHGKDYNTAFNYMVADMCQESLLRVHPTTLEFVPNLATHWQLSEDRSTYRFRINPEARWSDGTEVTSADVVATYDLKVDEKCLFPSSVFTYGKLERPKAISKYIVEVKVKEESWRNFLYFSGMPLMPAAEISIPGDQYLDKFQNAYPALSGPYHVNPEDIEMGSSLTITRRTDWWGKDNPAWGGMWNIDEYKVYIVKDMPLAYAKAKAGEIDYFPVPKAQWWAEEIPEVEAVKRGQLVMRKFFTDAPIGTSGIAINMSRKPLDDLRVRKALQLLYDRELMIQQLYFNEYEPLDSYYQGGTYQNQANERYKYDPVGAVELLEEAGWTEKNARLIRVKDGKTLRFEVQYRSPLSERNLTIFKESCADAGIDLELKLITPSEGWKNLTEKKYDLFSTAWGALVFPNPETSFHSRLAEQTGNNNVTAFKNERVDELCKAYDEEYDVKKRIGIIQKIDGILYQEMPYVLGWYGPSQRVIYWNKFGMPEWGAARTWDRDNLHYVWWVDPEKEAALEASKKDNSMKLEVPPIENHFWKHWNEAQGK